MSAYQLHRAHKAATRIFDTMLGYRLALSPGLRPVKMTELTVDQWRRVGAAASKLLDALVRAGLYKP